MTGAIEQTLTQESLAVHRRLCGLEQVLVNLHRRREDLRLTLGIGPNLPALNEVLSGVRRIFRTYDRTITPRHVDNATVASINKQASNTSRHLGDLEQRLAGIAGRMKKLEVSLFRHVDMQEFRGEHLPHHLVEHMFRRLEFLERESKNLLTHLEVLEEEGERRLRVLKELELDGKLLKAPVPCEPPYFGPRPR